MVATDAQKLAMRKYKAKMMANPLYRDEYNKKTNEAMKKKYKDDENFRKHVVETKYLKYYYLDAQDKAIQSIRRIL
jgi:hypothetical protein